MTAGELNLRSAWGQRSHGIVRYTQEEAGPHYTGHFLHRWVRAQLNLKPFNIHKKRNLKGPFRAYTPSTGFRSLNPGGRSAERKPLKRGISELMRQRPLYWRRAGTGATDTPPGPPTEPATTATAVCPSPAVHQRQQGQTNEHQCLVPGYLCQNGGGGSGQRRPLRGTRPGSAHIQSAST